MYKLTDVYDESYIFEPGDENFMVAFALEDYFTYEFKNNSAYIKWAAIFETIEDERHVKQEIPMRFCTDEDYDKFYPVKESNANKLKLIREDPNRGMLCLDWENSGVQFQGSEGSTKWSYLDVVVMPCNVKLTNLGAEDDRISPECSGDL